MKERPILFSAPMVRAILAGRKTQTRRVAKLNIAGRLGRLSSQWHPEHPGAIAACPYGQPGDRLWVREAWAAQCHEPCEPHERGYQDLYSPVIRYVANGATRRFQGNRVTGEGIYHGVVERTRPSIHMPRWASRITLEITDVRVQKLQEINIPDAMAEGIKNLCTPEHNDYGILGVAVAQHPVRAFSLLWDSINLKRGFEWNANPWVWAIRFRNLGQDGAT